MVLVSNDIKESFKIIELKTIDYFESAGYIISKNKDHFSLLKYDRTAGSCIRVKKSVLNSADNCSFCFELVCATVSDYNKQTKEKRSFLTTTCLVSLLTGVYSYRSGEICRGHDYWYEIIKPEYVIYSNPEINNKTICAEMPECFFGNVTNSVNDFFSKEILPDLEIIVDYCDDMIEKKIKGKWIPDKNRIYPK